MSKHLEIERRFIMRKLPTTCANEIIFIEQYYDDFGVRYRKSFNKTTEKLLCEKTIKSKVSAATNNEENLEISLETFEKETNENQRYVRKLRYVYYFSGFKFEVDSFDNIHLIIMEVELEDAKQTIHFPMWLEKLIIKEITDEPEFSNYILSRKLRDV